MHNNGSSGYGSLGSNDHLLSVASSSESNGNGTHLRQEEEESRRAKPVSYTMNSSSVGVFRFFVSLMLHRLIFLLFMHRQLIETVVDLFVFICMCFIRRPFKRSAKEFTCRKTRSSSPRRAILVCTNILHHHLSSESVLLCVTPICV